MRLAGAPGGTVGRQKSTYILCTLEACEELPPRNHVGMSIYVVLPLDDLFLWNCRSLCREIEYRTYNRYLLYVHCPFSCGSPVLLSLVSYGLPAILV